MKPKWSGHGGLDKGFARPLSGITCLYGGPTKFGMSVWQYNLHSWEVRWGWRLLVVLKNDLAYMVGMRGLRLPPHRNFSSPSSITSSSESYIHLKSWQLGAPTMKNPTGWWFWYDENGRACQLPWGYYPSEAKCLADQAVR
jgi:hypothetical protein